MAHRDGPNEAQMKALNPNHSVQIQGLKVSNSNNYSYVTARCNVGVKGAGKWYYEVSIDQNADLRIGWSSINCTLQPKNNSALGTDNESWGYDGQNATKYCNGNSSDYGTRYWKNGDIIGVLLDLDSRKISYFQNGKDLGVAFTSVPRDKFLYPSVSVRRYQGVTFNFGKKKFKKLPSGAYPLHSLLNSAQKTALGKLYEHYQSIGVKLSESMEDRGDICKADGAFEFANDLGAEDDADPLLLIVSWKVGADEAWEFDRKEWERGFALYGLYDIKTIKAAAHRWKKETFSDNEGFRPFYLWCFGYLLDNDRKILSIEEVQTLWLLLKMESRWPKAWDKWDSFLTDKVKRTHLSRDEWGGLLSFIVDNPDGVTEDYDDTGAYPLLLDDFVDFCNGKEDNSDSSSE